MEKSKWPTVQKAGKSKSTNLGDVTRIVYYTLDDAQVFTDVMCNFRHKNSIYV